MNSVGSIAHISGLKHSYRKTLALGDIALNIQVGRMTGLIGPDGAGKSTLMGLIAGVRKLQNGTLEVFGGSMSDRQHRRTICNRIAYMPQGLGKNLYQEISVAENLTFFAKLHGLACAEYRPRIHQLATATGLFPFLNRPAGHLSGGMKQKLGLCCALIHEPDLLILDEPTTGVDPLSRRQFWTLIADLRRSRPGMSVLVSTAYMDEATHCEQLIAMDHGKVLASGTPDELRAATGEQALETVFAVLLSGDQRKENHFSITSYQPVNTEPVIIAKNLTRRFDEFTAVDRVNFTIQQGEIFGFLGSNGCGKSTTMKMLTGLLTPTEGSAEVFGSTVDAHDMSVRRRVGFMTQSFSLYEELTVRQNLLLHARLFQVSKDDAIERSNQLIRETGLTNYADSKSGSLPLGLRQRLSLAVAIVHKPEILILDEPTSGVDPQARDEFWQLLLDLSRKQQVTIFVSTHFMSEAMRCDRISLMHASRVLVSDTPENVITSKQAADLEEAFIAYIEQAENEQIPVVSQGTTVSEVPESVGNTMVLPRFMPLQRLLAYTQTETLTLIRDPIRLAFAFAGSFLMMLLFGFGMSADVTNLTYAAFDQDNTPESRAYLDNLSSSLYFTEREPIHSLEEMERRLRSNDITLAVEIPPNFGRQVKREAQWQVSMWIDGAHTMRAATIEGYVQQAHQHFLERKKIQESASAATSAITFQVRYRYNPTNESIYAMGPSVPAMLLMMFMAILVAVSIAREKEIGTITNFYVTPTTRLEFLVGKQLPYLVTGLIIFVIMAATVQLIFGVPLKGSAIALLVGSLLYIAATTSYGLFISALTKSQVAAVFTGAVLSMLPTMQFSGMIQPVSTLEGGARLMGSLWPTTYYRQISVGAFTKGLGFQEMLPDLLALALFTPVFLFLAIVLLKKQEK